MRRQHTPKQSAKRGVSDKDRKLILAYSNKIAQKTLKTKQQRDAGLGAKYEPVYSEIVRGLYERPLTLTLLVASKLEDKVVIVAGPTNQPIPRVRDISNECSGTLILKLFDSIVSLEASLHIDTNFYGYYADYLAETYADVDMAFRPKAVSWWKEHIADVLVISTDRDNLVAIISKQKIEDMVSQRCSIKPDKTVGGEDKDTIGSLKQTRLQFSTSLPLLSPRSSPRSAADGSIPPPLRSYPDNELLSASFESERPLSRRNQRSRGSNITFLGYGENVSFDARGNSVTASAAVDVPNCFPNRDEGEVENYGEPGVVAPGEGDGGHIVGAQAHEFDELANFQDCMPIKFPPIGRRQGTSSGDDEESVFPSPKGSARDSGKIHAELIAPTELSAHEESLQMLVNNSTVEVISCDHDEHAVEEYEDDEYSFLSSGDDTSLRNGAHDDDYYGSDTIMMGFKKPVKKQHHMVTMLRSERLVRRFIEKGRKQHAKDAKTLNKELTWTEGNLLHSPYAKVQYNSPAIRRTIEQLDSFVTDNEGAYRAARDWMVRDGLTK
jgi:hypothetical protein